MKTWIVFLLALGLLGALSARATTPQPVQPDEKSITGLHFYHGDWELACDNTRTCRAAGYHNEYDEDDYTLSVLLTRKAGSNEPVTGQLMIGQYGENPTLDSLPSVFKLSLRINGKSVGQVTIPQSSLVSDLTPNQVTALLAALVRTSDIKLMLVTESGDIDEGISWRMSGKGATAVLLKMDEFQGRIDTPGALVRKGKRDEASVLPPLPIPVVYAAPVHKPLPDDELFVEKNSAALIEAIRATITEDDYPFLSETEPDGMQGAIDLKATRLTETKMLLSGLCWRAAYNAGSCFWIINSKPPYQPIIVTADGESFADRTIYSSHKGRGLGDCRSSDEWTWEGKQFVHTHSSTTGMCRLVAPGGAWSLPTIVTKVLYPECDKTDRKAAP
ncbi:MAG: DUF1176 domain-containing protein [Betaproteobacteria bacterium]|nr:DUF1176 domain-containing protein [Betaproteobacteria bacterium]